VIGRFYYQADLRVGLAGLFRSLGDRFELTMLSGDSDHQKSLVAKQLPWLETLNFNQTPVDKLNFIDQLHRRGKQVMMLGDGLNDAGALKNSDVGLAVTENPQYFTPASDGILHAASLNKLDSFMRLARWSQFVIIGGIGLSFLYNVVGLSFAVSGNLTPLTAAVLMPLSSISVVVFTTLAVKFRSLKLGLE
jgi:Cu+-exporting ATPase